MLGHGGFSERAARIVPATCAGYADAIEGIRDRSAFPAANDVAPGQDAPSRPIARFSKFTQGGLGEAVTGRIAIGTFALFMPPGSNTIRRNALRLLRPCGLTIELVRFWPHAEPLLSRRLGPFWWEAFSTVIVARAGIIFCDHRCPVSNELDP